MEVYLRKYFVDQKFPPTVHPKAHVDPALIKPRVGWITNPRDPEGDKIRVEWVRRGGTAEKAKEILLQLLRVPYDVLLATGVIDAGKLKAAYSEWDLKKMGHSYSADAVQEQGKRWREFVMNQQCNRLKRIDLWTVDMAAVLKCTRPEESEVLKGHWRLAQNRVLRQRIEEENARFKESRSAPAVGRGRGRGHGPMRRGEPSVGRVARRATTGSSQPSPFPRWTRKGEGESVVEHEEGVQEGPRESPGPWQDEARALPPPTEARPIPATVEVPTKSLGCSEQRQNFLVTIQQGELELDPDVVQGPPVCEQISSSVMRKWLGEK